MSTESIVVPKVEEYFSRRGWKVSREVKLRGRVIDIVAVKDEDIVVVEVKGSVGDIESGIEQALHQKKAANFSYLAIPKERSTDKVINTCKNLGIGLILLNDDVKEAVKPIRGNALLSVRKKILGAKPQKRERKLVLRSSLEYLFKSKSQILILKLLFLNSTKEFHLHDIARRTELAPSTVLKEIRDILNIGLVVKRTQGNLILYKINNKSVIFDELKRIFLKYELLDEIIAKELHAEQIKYALIYGSFAKGTEVESSDIDLFIVGKIKENVILTLIRGIEGNIGREINYILWTVAEFEKKRKEGVALLREIATNPIIMIVGDEDEFRRTVAK